MADRDFTERWDARDTRYDALLAGIPVAFGLAYVMGSAHLAGRPAALGAAAAASGLLVLAALFYEPPTPADTPERA